MRCLRLLIPLLIFLLAVAGVSGAVKKKGEKPRLIGTDSTSTFEVGTLTGVTPLDTIAVPLYLNTSKEVTYIENRINWTASDLALISVTKGPGVPDDSSVVLAVENQTDNEVQFNLTVNGAPIGIAGGQPIVYLNFEVQCFGYWATTWVNLADDNNYNYYISGGAPGAPLRVNGSVRTEDHSWVFVIGDDITTFSGKQGIAWEVDYHQDVPGRLASAYISYDSGILRFDSLAAGPDLDGGNVWGFDIGDTIAVILYSSTLEADRQLNLFTLYFSLRNDADDFTTPLNIVRSASVTECGDQEVPLPINGFISVPPHTASADIGDITAYNTATYYDVPFTMDSSFPVNDFEFHLIFPSEDLIFKNVIEVIPFTPPFADSIGSYLQINNRSGTDYQPNDLPATVFKLRFEPRSTPAVGDTFHIVFEDNPENEVRYNMDLPGFHTANPLTLSDGKIVIKRKPGGGGGGCPTLYVWNGGSFEKENTILAASASEYRESDVSDYYLISGEIASDDDGRLRFQVREDGLEISTFSSFQLMVVDHPADKPIQVTNDGKLMSLRNPISLKWARDDKGRDITELVSAPDGVFYTSKESGWIEVSYGKPSKKQRDNFLGVASIGPPKPKDHENEEQTRTAGVAEPLSVDKKIHVSMQTANGAWQNLGEIDPRLKPARRATHIDAGQIAPSDELIIRYSWEGYYQVDVLELHRTEPFEGEATMLQPSEAIHNKEGSVLGKLLDETAGYKAKLGPGEVIDLAFSTQGLPGVKEGMKRDIVFISKGRYVTPGRNQQARNFALYPNVPNPFNPNTSIRYYLPKETFVELKIFDVEGRLVRTLVSEFQSAGEKTRMWNGRSDLGHDVASGVYFYKLKTSEYQKTRKMILLK